MSSYKGRVALVTGASSGIGAAIAEELVKAGLIVVGAARRVENIQALSDKLKDQPGRLLPRKLDVSQASEIEETFKWIESQLGGVDVLINNAVTTSSNPVYEYTLEDIKHVTDVNIVGLVYATREAVKGMSRRRIDDGYIININSIMGHSVPYCSLFSLGLYPACKHAMTAFCQQLRHDFKNAGLKFRVTSISPGFVATELTAELQDLGIVRDFLSPEDVARTITFVLSMPKSAEITELIIKPTNEVMG